MACHSRMAYRRLTIRRNNRNSPLDAPTLQTGHTPHLTLTRPFCALGGSKTRKKGGRHQAIRIPPIEKENVEWESRRELFGRIDSALGQLRGGIDFGWVRRCHERRFPPPKKSVLLPGRGRIYPSIATPNVICSCYTVMGKGKLFQRLSVAGNTPSVSASKYL